jgi:hypothetical protein
MTTKYEPLRKWLTRASGDRVRLSFREIESILGFRLPDSARALAQWWANTRGSHVQAGAWMEAGWRARHIDVPGEEVSFERVIRPSTAGPAPASIAGVSDAGAPYRIDDPIVVDRAALRGGAIRMLEDYRDAEGGSLGDAAAHMLNSMAFERRRQLLDWIKSNAPSVPGDSADLIREDRDAR